MPILHQKPHVSFSHFLGKTLTHLIYLLGVNWSPFRLDSHLFLAEFWALFLGSMWTLPLGLHVAPIFLLLDLEHKIHVAHSPFFTALGSFLVFSSTISIFFISHWSLPTFRESNGGCYLLFSLSSDINPYVSILIYHCSYMLV